MDIKWVVLKLFKIEAVRQQIYKKANTATIVSSMDYWFVTPRYIIINPQMTFMVVMVYSHIHLIDQALSGLKESAKAFLLSRYFLMMELHL